MLIDICATEIIDY